MIDFFVTQSATSDIKPVFIEEEMKKSYLDYAMSVIVSRALPDIRDGLKPVHRRILYSMKETGNDYNKPYRKSARVVGDVMGKYHPHGDMAIYDAMIRLAQDFNMRLPLIDGQGNFGSMDGDPPAAARYTEARLARAAQLLLVDIDEETVDFQPNYDESTTEPKVLPARFPNLLANGSHGIAVGMATNIPPHNLGEIIDACCALIDRPDLSFTELLELIPGPDFPSCGIIMGRKGIVDGFQTGRGSITVRSQTTIEEMKDRSAIVVTEIPYQVNKAKMVERIAELVKEKLVEGISDLRDESNREGVRVVIELKRDAQADVVLNQLYKFSPLQVGYSFNVLALVQGRPEQLSLQQMLTHFLAFREEVITKRTRYQLNRFREKAHVLLGFAIAVSNIDEVIQLIRTAQDRSTAREGLMKRTWSSTAVMSLIHLVDPSASAQEVYEFDETQANAILDLRLHRLTGLEREKIQGDLNEIVLEIQDRIDVLSHRSRILTILKTELKEVKDLFATPRRTVIEDGASIMDMDDLIPKEEMVITVSSEGYIKRVPLSTYRSQKRGGKGRMGMTMKDEDGVSDIFVSNTHSIVLFFSSLGRVYSLKTYKLPLGTPQAKGRAMVNLFPLQAGESITTILVLPQDFKAQQEESGLFLMFATSLGNVRRNSLSDFINIPSNGKKAMVFEEGECLVTVRFACEDDDVMIFTKNGICNRFSVSAVRVFSGRDSNGVRGIRLQKHDQVMNMTILKHAKISIEERAGYIRLANQKRQGGGEEIELDPSSEVVAISSERFQELEDQEEFILTVTENGYGKRSSAFLYRVTNRGTQGYGSIIVDGRNGKVVASFPVHAKDQIVLVTDQGQLIRCPVKDIRITGRTTRGVTIFRVQKNEKVVSVTRIPYDEESVDGEGGELPNAPASS
jgi:DNA gyrase subunit A